LTFGEHFKKSIEILKLNQGAIKETAGDDNAMSMALLFIVISGIAGAIGTLNPFGIIIYPIVMLIMYFVWTGILHVIALLFGGKASYMNLFKPVGLAAVLGWIAVIPFIGPFLSMLVSLWAIVVYVIIVKSVYDFSTGKAVAVVLIPLAIIFVLATVLAVFVGLALLSVIGLSGIA